MMQIPNENQKSMLGELGEVITLSLPIIITMTSHTLMQFTDALMLGRYGKEELAAVTPAGLVYFTIAAFLIGIVSCNNTFVSQSLGGGRSEECARYTRHAIYIAIAAQLCIVPLILFAKSMFGIFPHGEDIRALEVTYFRIRAYQLAGTGMTVALSTFFQATGRPLIPMFTGIAANVLNVLGDYGLIFGHFGLPDMGIAGAATATTLATYIEVALLLIVFLSPQLHRIYATRTWGHFEFDKIRQLLRIGIWSGVNFALDLGSWTIFLAWIVGGLGKDVLAANNAASQVMHLSLMPTIGLNIGVCALVGRHIGQGDIPGAKRRAYLSMGAACAYMTLMGILFVIFREPLIGLFMKEADRTPEVLRVGGIILCYTALFQFSDAIGILSHGSLKGAGDTRFPAIAALLVAWFFFLPAAAILGRPDVLGIHGAWAATVVYVWILDIVFFWRFVSGRWQKIDIFAG